MNIYMLTIYLRFFQGGRIKVEEILDPDAIVISSTTPKEWEHSVDYYILTPSEIISVMPTGTRPEWILDDGWSIRRWKRKW